MSPRHPVDPVDDRPEAPAAPASPSRRRFVRNAGLGAVALGAVAATGTALTGVASAQTATATEPPDLSAPDVALVQFLQSLMLAAQEILTEAAGSSRLGTEIAEEVRVFARHSGTQAGAFGALLTEDAAITAPNARLLAEGTAAVGGANAETALLQAIGDVLARIAATLQQSLGQAESFLVAGAIASVLPIVGQEVAALGTAANAPIDTWLPAFGTTDGALSPAAYPAS